MLQAAIWVFPFTALIVYNTKTAPTSVVTSTSDPILKEPLNMPDYYFNHSGPAVETGLDNLMLTQGWRRFKWDEVLHPKNRI